MFGLRLAARPRVGVEGALLQPEAFATRIEAGDEPAREVGQQDGVGAGGERGTTGSEDSAW